jgi:hypothetical protein
MLHLIRLLLVTVMSCAASAGQAAELSCAADQCIERINQIAAKTNPGLVFAKRNCKEGDGFTNCYYKSSAGPGISEITKAGSQNVQAIFIADPRVTVDPGGLSPAVGVYLSVIMEALDGSLNGDARHQFYNQLLQEFASAFEKGGIIQKSSGKLKYSLSVSTDKKLTIFGVSAAN